jgi:Amt family ammonium transporter
MAGASIYAFLFTYAMLKVINFITPVKVEEHAQQRGLDESLHGEVAYI